MSNDEWVRKVSHEGHQEARKSWGGVGGLRLRRGDDSPAPPLRMASVNTMIRANDLGGCGSFHRSLVATLLGMTAREECVSGAKPCASVAKLWEQNQT